MIQQPRTPGRLSLVFAPRARDEISSAYRWYESERLGLGEEFLDALDKLLQQIRDQPLVFRHVRGKVRRALMARFPYGVFFVDYPDRILIAAVVHARRHPSRWPRSPAR